EAADARIAAFEELAAELKAPWYTWRGGLLRALRATMHGRFADAERLADEALRAARSAGDAAAERVWTTNHEAQRRAAERHADPPAFEPQLRRSYRGYRDPTMWQAMGGALACARAEDEAGARFHLGLLPGPEPPLGNLFALFFLADAVALVGTREAVVY